MLWRRTTIAAVLLAIASGGAGAAEPVRTLASGILRIGTYFVNPPFEYMADGADIGFEVDLMEEIARRVRLKPAFVNTRGRRSSRRCRMGAMTAAVGGRERRVGGDAAGSEHGPAQEQVGRSVTGR